jgi:putative nucleotidyltransferase with HDIG domain
MIAKVLLIDHEDSVLDALARTLRCASYEIFTARDGVEALGALAQHDVAVIICDQDMPGISGSKILAESMKIRPHAMRITMTAQMDVDSMQRAINEGRITKFLVKPWNDEALCAAVAEAVRNYKLEHEVRRLNTVTLQQNAELATWNRHLEEKVSERTNALDAAYQETLDALVLALDTREQATAGHSRRVAIYCLFLALEYGYPEEDLEHVYRGALLHDIGKIGIPDSVLLKRGKLEASERRVIEQHVAIGGRILQGISYLQSAISIPQYHHERYDGQGYGCGLVGAQIPLPARLFAIVDVYDALRSERPYKKALSHDQANAHINANAGKQFDPAAVAVFAAVPGATWDRLAEAALSVEHFTNVLIACQKIRAKATIPSAA